MQGDSIVVEAHHRRAANGICKLIVDAIKGSAAPCVVTIAGESGSGKSEIARALADALAEHEIPSLILQQDDYFKLPPRSNDSARRKDIGWVGPQEVHLDVMNSNLEAFIGGADTLQKPLVNYTDDAISEETLAVNDARVLIVEGTYTTLLKNVDTRVFIDRSYLETRKHREKRARHASELDPFIDRVLAIEHEIIASHKIRATVIIDSNYEASPA